MCGPVLPEMAGERLRLDERHLPTSCTSIENMCWGAGLPSSGKLAELRDMGVGLDVAYFDFFVFITGNSNRNYI